MAKRMSESELLSVVRSDLEACSPEQTALSEQRAEAMQYYLCEPFGNEVEGRSQVVTSDVQDVIEGILPQLIKMFTSSDDVVLFDPVSPEDEEQANQESAYLNHVFYKDNEGFQILYDWFKDALLFKNGVVKYFWEEDTKEVHESLEGLDPLQVQLLLADDNVEITGQSLETAPDGSPSISVNITRKNKRGRLKVVVVPPEDFRVYHDHNSIVLKDVAFCAQVSRKYKWELEEMGFPKDKIDELFSELRSSEEYDARFSDLDSGELPFNDEQVPITECYKRVDYDGDGYTELRRVTLGNESVLLENIEFDYIPFEAVTPIGVTHRFIGRSYADITMDFQLYKSTLLRNIFDNLYLINNQRTGVVDGEVEIDDLLDSRPGGVVRMSAPGMVFPITTQGFPASAYDLIETMDNMKENRTGLTRYNQGLDANALNKTATGITRVMDASNERVLLVARLFADGLKRLFLGMHRVLLQNQDKPRIVRLRNKWVPVNPSEWQERENMTINVALGTNDKQAQVQALMLIGQIQKEMMMAGKSNMVDDTKLFNAAKKLVEASGFKHVELFFKDPATQPPPPPPQPSPEIEINRMIAQAELEKAKAQQAEVQLKAQVAQNDFTIQLQKLELERLKLRLESEKAALDGLQTQSRQRETARSNKTRETIDAIGMVSDTAQRDKEGKNKLKSDILKVMAKGESNGPISD